MTPRPTWIPPEWLLELIWWLSRTINLLTGGYPGQMLCARVGGNAILREEPLWWWRLLETVLDQTFAWLEPRHCQACYLRWLTETAHRATPTRNLI